MPIRNISLTEHFDHFIEDQIKAGQFHDANEAIGAGLRLLEQQTREDAEKIANLRKLTQEGLDSLARGEFIELHGEDELSQYINGVGERAAKSVAQRQAM